MAMAREEIPTRKKGRNGLIVLILLLFLLLPLPLRGEIGDIERLQERVDDLESDLQIIRRGWGDDRNRIDKLEKQTNELKKELQSIPPFIRMLVEEIKALRKRLADEERKRKELEDLTTQIKADTKEDLKAMKEEILSATEPSIAQQSIRFNQLLDNLETRLKEEVTRNRKDLDNLRGELVSVKQGVGTLKEEINRVLNGTKKDLNEKLATFKDQVDKTLIKRKDEILSLIEKDRQERRAVIEALKGEITRMLTEVEKKQKERDKVLLKELELRKEEIASLKASLQDFSTRDKELDRRINLLNEALKNMANDLDRKREEDARNLAALRDVTIESIKKLEERLNREKQDSLERIKNLEERITTPADLVAETPVSIFSTYFAVGSTTPEEDDALRKGAELLLKNALLRVRIYGWADTTGNPKDSLRVARERAMNVADYLVSKGIDRRRIVSIQAGIDLNPIKKFARRVDLLVSGPGPLYTAKGQKKTPAPPKVETSKIEKKMEKPEVSPSPDLLYGQAMEHLRRKNFPEALRLFQRFLSLYPKDRLSDNAQYWIGEIYYAEGNFEKAIREFAKVIDLYPHADKVPAALLKQALSFYNLHEMEKAKALLERVRKDYPDSEEGRIATEKLKEFGLEG